MNLKDPRIYKIRKYEIPTKVERRLKVALLGDLHVSPIVGKVQLNFLKKSFKKIKPDLIVFQGDLFDSPEYLLESEMHERLILELKLAREFAPTIAVLGNHDQLYPGKFRYGKDKIFPDAIEKWAEISKETGVKILNDEWFEFENVRFFGFLEDAECFVNEKGRGEDFSKIERKIKKLEKDDVLNLDSSKTNWLLSHAPLQKLIKMKEIEGFEILSFGHTHGGCVPRGIDEIYDKIGFTGGFYAPFGRIFPLKQMRGIEKLPDGRKLIVNSGMVFTQYCTAKLFQNLNFLKAAEVTEVILLPEKG